MDQPAPPTSSVIRQPQVKVMRLALTRAGPVTTAASSRGSLLTLPTVFEAIHAGQQLKCLARILNSPPNCLVLAKLEQSKSGQSVEVGTVFGEGKLDLLVKGRLLTNGPHELVVTCSTKEHGELLKKVYRIEVSPSLIYHSPPKISFIQEKVLVRFTIRNASKDMYARITKVEFKCEKGIKSTPACYPISRNYSSSICDIFLNPEETCSYVFQLSSENETIRQYGKLSISWTSGLGEDCVLHFPTLTIDHSVIPAVIGSFQMEDGGRRKLKVGQAVSCKVARSNQTEMLEDFDGSFLTHGPRQLKQEQEVFLVPTRPGIFNDVSHLFGVNNNVAVFVDSGENNLLNEDQGNEHKLMKSPSISTSPKLSPSISTSPRLLRVTSSSQSISKFESIPQVETDEIEDLKVEEEEETVSPLPRFHERERVASSFDSEIAEINRRPAVFEVDRKTNMMNERYADVDEGDEEEEMVSFEKHYNNDDNPSNKRSLSAELEQELAEEVAPPKKVPDATLLDFDFNIQEPDEPKPGIVSPSEQVIISTNPTLFSIDDNNDNTMAEVDENNEAELLTEKMQDVPKIEEGDNNNQEEESDNKSEKESFTNELEEELRDALKIEEGDDKDQEEESDNKSSKESFTTELEEEIRDVKPFAEESFTQLEAELSQYLKEDTE